MFDLHAKLAQELAVNTQQVAAAIELLDQGATVPFIARYRKEVTQGLNDIELRQLEEKLLYWRDLEARRQVIIKSLTEQEKLTDALKEKLYQVDNKTQLEDIYLPYKPKRRNKAQMAKEAGLQPLADYIAETPQANIYQHAQAYINFEQEVDTIEKVAEGCRYILMEYFSEHAELREKLRNFMWEYGILHSTVVPEQEENGAKFKDYFDYQEKIAKIPSHRALALFRGRNTDILELDFLIGEDNNQEACIYIIKEHFQYKTLDPWLEETLQWAWKLKLLPQLELELKLQLKEQAEEDAIQVFTKNLKDLLLTSPAGSHITMGLDPGIRTGVKLAIIDKTGKVLETNTIYPHAPQNKWQESIETIKNAIKHYQITLIAIGNGTASRETDQLVTESLKNTPNVHKIIISEAGASVYSASEIAAQEFPDLDVSLRGAISIARRLQDPLAELVKIDAKSIGVGQYQHDVNQAKLSRSLDATVEDCVNAVGVDVNTASYALLTHVSGLGPSLAKNIVAYRDQNGAFENRETLKKVPRLGTKAFEQSAAFLRINQGNNPLDSSAVHPEAYPIVQKILDKTQIAIKNLIGNSTIINTLQAKDFTDQQFGLYTIHDIFKELEKPGRDPRPEFKMAKFNEDIHEITDLIQGMRLEGTITNVTDFGAFVDIGVHQDGLIHISQLANRFIKNPREIVKTGDIVTVTVVEIDLKRKRISLSMKENQNTQINQQ